MPVHIHYASETALLYATIRGNPTMQELKRAYAEVRSSTHYRPGMNRIWDLREASISHLSTNDVQALILESARHEPKAAQARVAVVVSDIASYGVARMAQGLGFRDLTIELGVFQSMAEAELWVVVGSEGESTLP